jgi:hypothetical protein
VDEDMRTQVFNTLLVVVKRIFAELMVGQNGGIRFSGQVSDGQWIAIGSIPIVLFVVLLLQIQVVKENLILLSIPFVYLLIYFGLIVISSKSLGSFALTNFNGAGRYFMAIHVMVFIIFLALIEFSPITKKPITQVAIYCLSFLFLLGVIFDFKLMDKSSSLTRSSWIAFSTCVETKKTDCEVIVPPGQTWGDW